MKFAERLAAHITPEWNSQYIKYDEMKEFLYQYEQSAPVQDDEHLLQRYFARADEIFFQFCDKELIKINTFFAEKLAEAQRKFESLKSELKENSNLMNRKKDRFRSSKLTLIEEDDEDDESKAKLLGDTTLGTPQTVGSPSRASMRNRKQSVISNVLNNTGAQTITQRLIEKNRERQLKNKQFRKEHDLKLAFSEFYLSLILLQNYQTLNFTGFRKILKKHDKIFKTDRGSEWHKAYVETAPFYTTKKVDTFINDVVNLFTQYLENGDRERAMKRLRVPPFEEKQSPWTTFRLGLHIGMILVLIPVVLMLIFFTYATFHELSFNWKIAIKLYRSPLFIIMHIFFIGINSYGWSRSGVNHVLIFEIDPRNHLTYQQLLEMGSFLGTFWFVSLIMFIISAYYNLDYYIFPLALVVFLTVFLINPIPRFQFSSRAWVMNTLWKILAAPFYPVAFAHFWLADQLTSFEFLFIDIQFFICWFLFQAQWAPLKNFFPDSPCIPSNNRDLSITFNLISLFLMCLPSLLRFLQCLRRFKDTSHAFPHLANALKYATTFFDVAALSLKYHFSYMYKSDWESPFFYIWLIVKFIATCYKLVWDLKMDWGFFDKNAGENKFLREVIVYSSKNYYYFAIVQNVLLRFLWLVRLYDIGLRGETYKDLVTTMLGFLEVFRRFIWNFFRLENEHLNNCGQFRAVRDISISPIQMTDLSVIEKMMDDEDGLVNRQHTLNMNSKQNNNNLTITKSRRKKSLFWPLVDDIDRVDYKHYTDFNTTQQTSQLFDRTTNKFIL
ncbi:unnamed protein product [Brachionus calyciflorus]|uniref:Xenotropic and polytropic retrovirus receptor 1-like protein n=1 Tax=Brachionus calyciflorus TaxID=104777 RepID=A0A813U1R5_9BILA|nr:unnamed protein product [Brachionus calyciflorus]